MADLINATEEELQPVTDTTRDAARTDNTPSEESPSKLKASQPFYIYIKRIALLIIGLCVLVGAILSKITLVSITGRMFSLVSFPDEDNHTLPQSILFAQLTLILVIPEVVSLMRCLIWGVIGKTKERFPWPNRKTILVVSQYNTSA